MSRFHVGQQVVLAQDIVEQACGEHPALLLGRAGLLVTIERASAGFDWYVIPSDGGRSDGFAVTDSEITEVPA